MNRTGNETIRTLHAHRSIRSYTDEPVSDEMLDAIVEAAHRGPTSMNAQEISLVVVRDAEKRKRISECANGQAWIARAPVFIAIIPVYCSVYSGPFRASHKWQAICGVVRA